MYFAHYSSFRGNHLHRNHDPVDECLVLSYVRLAPTIVFDTHLSPLEMTIIAPLLLSAEVSSLFVFACNCVAFCVIDHTRGA